MSVPQQTQEQREVDAKESSSGAEANKMSPTRKIAGGPEVEPFESSKPGVTGLGKRFLEDQKQIWTTPAKARFSSFHWLTPPTCITAARRSTAYSPLPCARIDYSRPTPSPHPSH